MTNSFHSGVWLVNILLRKVDTLSKKEMKMTITQFFWWKSTKKCLISIYLFKVVFFTLSSPHRSVIEAWSKPYTTGNCMFKVSSRKTRASCEISSKLTIKMPERPQWRRSGIFIVNFEHISHLVLVFLLLTLNM